MVATDSLLLPFHTHFDNIAGLYPGKTAMWVLDSEGNEADRANYARLRQHAKHVASYLQKNHAKGDRCLILTGPGIDFVVAFLGCLYAGLIAVPALPPRKNRRNERLAGIVKDSKPAVALVSKEVYDIIQSQGDTCELPKDLPIHLIEGQGIIYDDDYIPERIDMHDVAMLQYTSGTTGEASGVIITHDGLMHNSGVIRNSFNHDHKLVGVTWLPPYHDMGLIGTLLQPLYTGGSIVIINPMDFLKNPMIWLKAVSKYGCTTTGGPNFAFDHVTERVTDADLDGLDLGSLKVMFCGSERVRSESLERFSTVFAPCGFCPEMFLPCYGLAEATLMLTGIHQSESYITRNLASHAHATGDRIQEAGPGDEGSTHVGCGRPWLGDLIVIVDPATNVALPEGHVGEIFAQGKAISPGYWNKPKKTISQLKARIPGFEGTFLRTGDLGAIYNGQLYITGRIKELIIINGVNYYPSDLEKTVEECHPALQTNGCGVFSIDGESSEELVVIQEIRRTALQGLDTERVIDSIIRAVGVSHEISINAIWLIMPGHLPKTHSGKIRHNACKQKWLEGKFKTVYKWEKQEGGAENMQTTEAEEISEEMIREWLISWISRKSRIAKEKIDPDEQVLAYGIDSMGAVELERDAEEAFGIELHPLDLMENNRIRELARIGYESLQLNSP